MNARLAKIQDWPELARQANWSVGTLAKHCGVSTETLRQFFLLNMGKTARTWLAEERQWQAVALLRDGSSIKETSICLAYKQQGNFTRVFTKYWGVPPSNFVETDRPQGKTCENDKKIAKMINFRASN